jgi:hypothetical protein
MLKLYLLTFYFIKVERREWPKKKRERRLLFDYILNIKKG